MNKLFINNQQINWQIKRIANKINHSHDLENDKVTFICLLKGGGLFFHDLIKRIKIKNLEIEYIRVKSFINNNERVPKLDRFEMNTLPENISYYWERYFYIIDDIAETGQTLNFIFNTINRRSNFINDIRMVTILKRKSYPGNLFDFGFEIKDDGFMYGYGMDNEGKDRNLKDIWVKTL